jgi:hypothetical protein
MIKKFLNYYESHQKEFLSIFAGYMLMNGGSGSAYQAYKYLT